MITIKNLKKNYGETRAVRGLNLEVPEGQILGILGPNGAGKTTTLRIITGYLTPTSGEVLINGINVAEDPVSTKRIIGYLPESSPIYTDMLVYDFLNYIADIRGIPSSERIKRIMDVSKLCGITEAAHKPVSDLSKGYRQRVGLALALIDDPEILVLDEPTSGLDPNQIAEIRTIIKDIGKKKTIIFSTHILSEAEATCDRVVIMNQGELVADGTTEMLQGSGSRGQITGLQIADTTPAEVEKLLKGIGNISRISTEKSGNIVNVSVTSDDDIRADIYKKIKEKEWILLEMTRERKTLEHVFRELTKEG